MDKKNVLEFVMSLNLFGNGFEKLNVFDVFGICVIPLPCSRRDKCKKTNIAQCMLHEQLTSLCFLCGKESSDLCSENRCFGVLCFGLNTRRGGGRPPLRLRATSGCN